MDLYKGRGYAFHAFGTCGKALAVYQSRRGEFPHLLYASYMKLRPGTILSIVAGCALILPVVFFCMVRQSDNAACDCIENPLDLAQLESINPLRSRGPEQVASQVLQALRDGKCQSMPATREHCDRESEYRIQSWHVTGRESSNHTVAIRFWVVRHAKDGIRQDNLWISVVPDKTSWTVSNAGLYY